MPIILVRRTIAEAGQNLKDSVSRIPAAYKRAVLKADWSGPASSDQAQTNWVAKMTDPTVQARRQANIRATPNAVWSKNSDELGGARIGTGITQGLAKYNTNFAPILTAMNTAAEAAPAKGVNANENIDNRLKPVVRAAQAAAGKI